MHTRPTDTGRGSRTPRRPSPLCGLGLGLLLMTALPAAADTVATPKETFSVDYVVTVTNRHSAVATVRWELVGIDEIRELRLHYDPKRLDHFEGSGRLEPIDGGLRWIPAGPYAHLTYHAHIDHVRGQHQRYDSYADGNWIVTRARDLFPRVAISCETREGERPSSRARLIFRLPPGWQSAAALPALGKGTYQLREPGRLLDRPHGWFALGKLRLDHREIAGMMIQVARAPGSALSPPDLFRLLETTLPDLSKLLHAQPATVLVVSAPDPMWHGGISGENSFYIHGKRPLRTADKTSPYLHELFHVLQPYKPAADADWIEEGLAEYYSLELQRRSGLVDPAAYARALGYFQRFGKWNVNLTQQQDNAATNNSAPLIMYALDQHIQHATAGKKRLDDVVGRLAQDGGEVDTARFMQVVKQVSGKPLTKFFDRHVVHGIPFSHHVTD